MSLKNTLYLNALTLACRLQDISAGFLLQSAMVEKMYKVQGIAGSVGDLWLGPNRALAQ
jgi:hypothetical protein